MNENRANKGIEMLKKYWMVVILVFAVLGTSLYLWAYPRATKNQVLSQLLMKSLSTWHFSPQEIDDDFSKKAFKLYLKNLDSNKRLLIQSDINLLKNYEADIDNEVRSGQFKLFSFAEKLHRARLGIVEMMYKTILKKPFDLFKSESVILDPDKRKFSKSDEELKSFWKKSLKYQTILHYFTLVNAKKVKKGKSNLSLIKKITKRNFSSKLEKKARGKVLKNLDKLFERLKKETKEERFANYLNAIMMVFDPHTQYFPPAVKEDFDIAMTGKLEGIGALLREDDGFIKIVRIIPGSASWRQKELQAEDVILKVAQADGEPVDIVGMRVRDAVKLIRGKKGTEVRLTVKKADGRIAVIPIIRDVVILEATYAKSGVINNTNLKKRFGYIQLTKFYRDFNNKNGRNSSTDVKNELLKLKKQDVRGVILDLRNNGGGALEDAVQLSGLFINDGPIVQVKDRIGRSRILKDKDDNIVYSGPLVVLVNSFSASASEIVAAALQDYGRAIVVGTKQTFGKGTVQTLVGLDRYLPSSYTDMSPLGTIKLTIQKFYRINGGSTQYKGVASDVLLPDPYGYIDAGEKSLDFSLPWDKTKSLDFDSYIDKKVSLEKLRKKSANRVNKSKRFNTIKSYVKKLHEIRNEKKQELSIVAVHDEQNRIKKINQIYKTNQKSIPQLIVVPNKVKVKDPKLRKNRIKQEKEWRDTLKKDVILLEATAILNDIVSQQRK